MTSLALSIATVVRGLTSHSLWKKMKMQRTIVREQALVTQLKIIMLLKTMVTAWKI